MPVLETVNFSLYFFLWHLLQALSTYSKFESTLVGYSRAKNPVISPEEVTILVVTKS